MISELFKTLIMLHEDKLDILAIHCGYMWSNEYM